MPNLSKLLLSTLLALMLVHPANCQSRAPARVLSTSSDEDQVVPDLVDSLAGNKDASDQIVPKSAKPLASSAARSAVQVDDERLVDEQDELDENGFPTPRPHSQGLEVLAQQLKQYAPRSVAQAAPSDASVDAPLLKFRLPVDSAEQLKVQEPVSRFGRLRPSAWILADDVEQDDALNDSFSDEDDLFDWDSDEEAELELEQEKSSAQLPQAWERNLDSAEIQRVLEDIDSKYGDTRQGNKVQVRQELADPQLGLRNYVFDSASKVTQARVRRLSSSSSSAASSSSASGQGQISQLAKSEGGLAYSINFERPSASRPRLSSEKTVAKRQADELTAPSAAALHQAMARALAEQQQEQLEQQRRQLPVSVGRLDHDYSLQELHDAVEQLLRDSDSAEDSSSSEEEEKQLDKLFGKEQESDEQEEQKEEQQKVFRQPLARLERPGLKQHLAVDPPESDDTDPFSTNDLLLKPTGRKSAETKSQEHDQVDSAEKLEQDTHDDEEEHKEDEQNQAHALFNVSVTPLALVLSVLGVMSLLLVRLAVKCVKEQHGRVVPQPERFKDTDSIKTQMTLP